MILYVGSFTEIITGNFGGKGDGISCFEFNPDTGSLELLHVYPATNASYLSIPSAEFLYTHTELLQVKNPRVQAYKINAHDFSLQLLNEQAIPGGCPCHINFSKSNNCVLVACYETGNTFLYPVAKSGELFPQVNVLQHKGTGLNKLRQEKAHAHAVVLDENFSNILVTDLGMDRVMVYHLESKTGRIAATLKQKIVLPPGSGPRHIAIHPESKFAYILNELTATITVMRYHEGDFEPLRTYPILPKEFKQTPSAAAIRISDNGKFIYVSEREDNCIIVFAYDDTSKAIEIIERQKTMGKTPRDIQLDKTGNWLLAANQDSDSVAVFKIDKNSGMLNPEHLVENIKSPACLSWLPVN